MESRATQAALGGLASVFRLEASCPSPSLSWDVGDSSRNYLLAIFPSCDMLLDQLFDLPHLSVLSRVYTNVSAALSRDS